MLLLCNNGKEKVGAGAQDYTQARSCRTHKGESRSIGRVVVKSEPQVCGIPEVVKCSVRMDEGIGMKGDW